MSGLPEQAKRIARLARLATEVGQLDGQMLDGGADAVGTERYLLIERNYRYARGYWLSTHDTPADAGCQVVGQEYAEEWETIALVDLDTGERFDARVSCEWVPAS